MDHDCRQDTCQLHAEHKAAVGVVKVKDMGQALKAADPFQREGSGMPYNPGIVFYPRMTYLP